MSKPNYFKFKLSYVSFVEFKFGLINAKFQLVSWFRFPVPNFSFLAYLEVARLVRVARLARLARLVRLGYLGYARLIR